MFGGAPALAEPGTGLQESLQNHSWWVKVAICLPEPRGHDGVPGATGACETGTRRAPQVLPLSARQNAAKGISPGVHTPADHVERIGAPPRHPVTSPSQRLSSQELKVAVTTPVIPSATATVVRRDGHQTQGVAIETAALGAAVGEEGTRPWLPARPPGTRVTPGARCWMGH